MTHGSALHAAAILEPPCANCTSPLLILLLIEMTQSHLLSSLYRLVAVRRPLPLCIRSHRPKLLHSYLDMQYP